MLNRVDDCVDACAHMCDDTQLNVNNNIINNLHVVLDSVSSVLYRNICTLEKISPIMVFSPDHQRRLLTRGGTSGPVLIHWQDHQFRDAVQEPLDYKRLGSPPSAQLSHRRRRRGARDEQPHGAPAVAIVAIPAVFVTFCVCVCGRHIERKSLQDCGAAELGQLHKVGETRECGAPGGYVERYPETALR